MMLCLFLLMLWPFYAYIFIRDLQIMNNSCCLKLTMALKVAVVLLPSVSGGMLPPLMFLYLRIGQGCYEFQLLASILRRSKRLVQKQASVNLNSQPSNPTFQPRSF